jgi:hypothetical protein
MTLFDTDVVIWMLRGNKLAAAAIDGAESRAMSAVSYMEVLHGARDAQDLRTSRRTLEALRFHILPVTESITERAVAIVEEHTLSVRLDPMDALIFATAFDYDITLCSGNEKHFRPIQGLRSCVFRPD